MGECSVKANEETSGPGISGKPLPQYHAVLHRKARLGQAGRAFDEQRSITQSLDVLFHSLHFNPSVSSLTDNVLLNMAGFLKKSDPRVHVF